MGRSAGLSLARMTSRFFAGPRVRLDSYITAGASIARRSRDSSPGDRELRGYVMVDAAEPTNAAARERRRRPLRRGLRSNGLKLLTYSTDLVFDGRKRTPYLKYAHGRCPRMGEQYSANATS